MNKLLELFIIENEKAKKDYDHEETWAESIAAHDAAIRLDAFKKEMHRQGIPLNYNLVKFKQTGDII